MKTTVDVLREARRLIERPESWTQGAYARTANGNSVEFQEANACAFCAEGALYRAMYARSKSQSYPPFFALRRAMGDRTIAQYNDAPTTTHDMILAAFDRAIAAESKAVPS